MYGWRHNFPHQMYNYILYIIFNYEGNVCRCQLEWNIIPQEEFCGAIDDWE